MKAHSPFLLSTLIHTFADLESISPFFSGSFVLFHKLNPQLVPVDPKEVEPSLRFFLSNLYSQLFLHPGSFFRELSNKVKLLDSLG